MTRPRGRLTFTIVLILFTSALTARSLEVSILPFRITGRMEPSYFTPAELPGLLQQTTHFLFQTNKNHALQPLNQTDRAIQAARWNADQKLDSKTASLLCLHSDAGYLLAGDAHFDRTQVHLRTVTYSCHSKSTVHTAGEQGSFVGIQTLIQKALLTTTPFARNRPAPLDHKNQRSLDLVLLLDYSGSMLSELPVIFRTLSAAKDRLPANSRLGAVVIGANNQHSLPFSENLTRTLEILQKTSPAGEVDIAQLARALNTVELYTGWRGERKLLIFSDAHTRGERSRELESRLRQLAQKNIQTQLFSLKGQFHEDRQEWLRLSRTLNFPDPQVRYGRRVSFLEGFSIFLVMEGSRFYRVNRELTPAALHASTTPFIPIETVLTEKRYLNLDDLPTQYAKLQKLHLAGVGPVISNLEKKIEQALLLAPQLATPYKVLVKNQGVAFWVGVSQKKVYETLKKYKGKSVYLGLRFAAGRNTSEKLTQITDSVYIQSQATVPRMLINTYTRLNQLPVGMIRPADVWFLLAEIQAFKDAEAGADIREN